MRRLLIALALLLAVPLISSCFVPVHRQHRRNCYRKCAYYSHRRTCQQQCEIYRNGVCVAYREVCRHARVCARYRTRCY